MSDSVRSVADSQTNSGCAYIVVYLHHIVELCIPYEKLQCVFYSLFYYENIENQLIANSKPSKLIS